MSKAKSEREKVLEERDEFQKEQDDNRQWHRPQEHVFEVEVSGDKKGPIVGGTAGGAVFIDSNGERRLTVDEVLNLAGQLSAAHTQVA